MLRCCVEGLEQVPPDLRQHYLPHDAGGFVLDLADDIRGHPKVAALANALGRAKADLRQHKDVLADIGRIIDAFSQLRIEQPDPLRQPR